MLIINSGQALSRAWVVHASSGAESSSKYAEKKNCLKYFHKKKFQAPWCTTDFWHLGLLLLLLLLLVGWLVGEDGESEGKRWWWVGEWVGGWFKCCCCCLLLLLTKAKQDKECSSSWCDIWIYFSYDAFLSFDCFNCCCTWIGVWRLGTHLLLLIL